MKTVEYILKTKRHALWSIAPEASADHAIRLMADKGIGALPVLEAGQLVGIVSEKDYITKVIVNNGSTKKFRVREIMAQDILYTSPAQAVEDCLELMTEKHIQHLPVMVDGHLTGIVSIEEVFRTIIADQDDLIRSLDNYILGIGIA